MTTPVIMDLVVGAVLLLFTVFGWRHGFVKSLAGLVITIIALVGAAVIAGTFADPAARMAAPTGFKGRALMRSHLALYLSLPRRL